MERTYMNSMGKSLKTNGRKDILDGKEFLGFSDLTLFVADSTLIGGNDYANS
jgi:hypothetical protein